MSKAGTDKDGPPPATEPDIDETSAGGLSYPEDGTRAMAHRTEDDITADDISGSGARRVMPENGEDREPLAGEKPAAQQVKDAFGKS